MPPGQRIEGLKGSWEWLAFAAGLPAKPILVPGISADTQLFTGRCIFKGFSVRNNSGGSSNFDLYDGHDANSPAISLQSTSSSQVSAVTLTGGGILVENGIFVHAIAGPINGSIFVVPLWHGERTPPGE